MLKNHPKTCKYSQPMEKNQNLILTQGLPLFWSLEYQTHILQKYRILLQVRKLNKTMEKLTEMPVSRKREIQATKKVMAVIGVFFCCNICMAITGTVTQNISITSNSRVILADITDVLLVLHCCLNVIIYSIFDLKFRRIFLKLFCTWSKTNKNELNAMKMSEIPQTSVSDSNVSLTSPQKLSMKPQQIGISKDLC